MMSGISSMVLLERLEAVGRLGHAEAGELQVLGVHLARVLIVVDDEHERARLSGLSWLIVRRLELAGVE